MSSPTILTILLSLLLPFLHLTTAHPHLSRRGLPGAVYICDEPNFRGNCQWNEPSGRCAQQGPAGVGVESLGPDPGGFCTLYASFDCSGPKSQTLRFPGIQANLPQFGSFKCFTDVSQARAKTVKGGSGLFDGFADPRLAGGVGSMDRREHLEEIRAMEEDNFSEGLIGLRKGVYY